MSVIGAAALLVLNCVVAVVAMDGEVRSDSVADTGFTNMQAAVMALTPSDMERHQVLFDRSVGADVTWVQLDGACHESFTSTNFGVCPTMEPTTGRRITANYAIAFGSRHVLESRNADLNAVLLVTADAARAAARRINYGSRVGAIVLRSTGNTLAAGDYAFLPDDANALPDVMIPG